MTPYIVQAAPPQHFSWLRSRTQCELSENFRAIEALAPDIIYCHLCGLVHGRIRGMVGYNGWTENAVSMHFAIEGPGAFKALHAEAFKYAFEQAGKKMVFGVTPSDNARAIKAIRAVGFREVYREKDGFADGVDIVFSRFTRSEWLAQQKKG